MNETKKVYDPQKMNFDKLLGEGITFVKNQQFFKAIPIFKELLNINPNNLKVINLLCESLFEQNKTREAISLAQKGLEKSRNQLNRFFINRFNKQIGFGFQKNSDYDKAIIHYKLALVQNNFDVDISIELSKCYLKLNKIKEALKVCEDAISYNTLKEEEERSLSALKITIEEEYQKSFPEEKYLASGNRYFDERKFQQALSEYEKAYHRAPNNILILEKLFLVNVELKKNKEAIEIGEKIISKDINFIKTFYKGRGEFSMLSNVYLNLYEIYKNSWHFIKRNQCESMYEYYQLILRGAYESTFSYKKGIEFFTAAYQKMPERYEALERLIVTLIFDRDYKTALKYNAIAFKIAKAEKDKQKLARYYELEALCYQNLAQRNKETESLEIELKFTDDIERKTYIYSRLAEIYKSQEKAELYSKNLDKYWELVRNGANDFLDLQSKLMEEQVEADKNSDYNLSYNFFRKGSLLYSQKKPIEALAELKKAFWLLPHELKIVEAYSRCLRESGFYKEASNMAYEGLEIACQIFDNKYAESFFLSVACYWFYDEANYDEARKFYELALRHNPYSFDHAYKIALCYDKLGYVFKAMDNYEKAYEMKSSEKYVLDRIYEILTTNNISESSKKTYLEWLGKQNYKPQ